MSLFLFSLVSLAWDSAMAFSPLTSAGNFICEPYRYINPRSTLSCLAMRAIPEVSKAAEVAFANAPAMHDVIEQMLSLDDIQKTPQQSALGRALLRARLQLARPWRRVKQGSVLSIPLGGALPERSPPRAVPFLSPAPPISLSEVTLNLRKAAADPRISGVLLNIKPLECGWGKVAELVRSVRHFQESGKFCVCYLETMTEKEAVVAAACSESYMPFGAYISLTGVSLKGQFLGDVLRKAGIEPQIQRIGAYKSAGDQLQRGNMSEAQREVLNAIADDVYAGIALMLARLGSGNRTEADVRALLDVGISDATTLAKEGLITGVRYMDEVEQILRERSLKPMSGLKKLLVTMGKEDKQAALARIERERKLPSVKSKRYAKVPPAALGLKGKKTIAVLRVSGAISGRASSGSSRRSTGISADVVINEVRKLRKRRKVTAVVLRVDSPGGDALASDLMWRELRLLAEAKPLVASMSDVAGSGGYYISMPASKIVAEGLTLTGSIGVITGKFELSELYRRIGYGKEFISRGNLAEVSADNRPFTEEEEAWIKANAQKSYEEFRDKAALCRSMDTEEMQSVAQGRVWTGRQAVGAKLVDEIGGLWTAIGIAKREAGIDSDVTVFEAGARRAKASDVVGTTMNALCLSLLNSALGGPNAALLKGLLSKTPQALALGLDPSLSGKSAYTGDHFLSEDEDDLWR